MRKLLYFAVGILGAVVAFSRYESRRHQAAPEGKGRSPRRTPVGTVRKKVKSRKKVPKKKPSAGRNPRKNR